jgi:hypothetical protein
MAVRVKREDLLRVLNSVRPGVSIKPTTTQSDCFAFTSGEVITFNDEIACRFSSGLPNDFEGAIPAPPLLALLKDLPDDEVRVEIGEEGMIIRGAGRRTRLIRHKNLPGDENGMPIESVEKPEKWQKLDPDFAEGIRMVAGCAGKGKSDVVHVHPQWVEASDTFQIGRFELETGVERSILVAPKSILEMTQLGMTKISITDNWIHFKNPDGLYLSCRADVLEWEDLTEHLKPLKGAHKVVMPKWLAKAAGRVDHITKENADKNYLTVTLEPGWAKIRGEGLKGEHSERKQSNYDGDTIAFMIAPGLLSSLIEKHNEFWITKDTLRVATGKFTYVTSLEEVGKKKEKDRGKRESSAVE